MGKRNSGQKRHQKALKRKKKLAKRSASIDCVPEPIPTISEIMAEFSQPLIDRFDGSKKGVEVAITIAVACWNIGASTESEAESIRDDLINFVEQNTQYIPSSVIDEFDDLADAGILSRRVFYRDDVRFISGVEIDWFGEDYRLRVESTVLPVEARNTSIDDDMLAGLSEQGREGIKTASAPLSDEENALIGLIDSGYELIEQAQMGDIPPDYATRLCSLWLPAWEKIKTFYKDLEDIDRASCRIDIDLADWIDNLNMQLYNAGIETKDRKYFEQRLTFCQEVCFVFPKSDPLLIYNFRCAQAESYFFTGQVEQGEAAFDTLVMSDPDNSWGYLCWGDVYNGLLWQGSELITPDNEKAKALYQVPIKRKLCDAKEAQLRLDELEGYMRGYD